jgi:hypothetical protein
MYSDTKSFKSFALSTSLPILSVFDKGEVRRKRQNKPLEHYQVSFDVSDKDWDQLKLQIVDAINFLESNFNALSKLKESHNVFDAYLDFPYSSRLCDGIVNQNDHLPKELISVAGRLNLGIEMSLYD